MNLIKNLKTGQKIIGLVLIMALFLVGLGYNGYYNVKKANEGMSNLYHDGLLSVKWLNEFRSHNRANKANLLEIIIIQDPVKQQKLIEDIGKRAKQANVLLGNYGKRNLDSYEKEQFAILKENLDIARADRAKVIELATSGKTKEAVQYFQANEDPLEKMNQAARNLAEYSSKKAEELDERNDEEASRSIMLIWTTVILAVSIALILGWLLARIIAIPLNEMMEKVESVAQGNLRVDKISYQSEDEVGHLAKAFNTMTGNLRDLVQKVHTSSQLVASSSQELNTGVEESAKASEQIATSIQGVAEGANNSARDSANVSTTTMEISAGIQQVAANIQSLATHAKQAADEAQEGNRELLNAINQMESISSTVEKSAQGVKLLGDRSQQIGSIVQMITDIASQTNLLALNAAIEAARAGEQGRGFAVVAEEVRKLAEESGKAAGEIAYLIRAIQEETKEAVSSMEFGTQEVKEGITVVNSAGRSFQRILQTVEDVSAQVQDISVSMEEMASGTNSLADSVGGISAEAKETQNATQEIAAATQEQTASLQEISASADILTGLAESLQKDIAIFTV